MEFMGVVLLSWGLGTVMGWLLGLSPWRCPYVSLWGARCVRSRSHTAGDHTDANGHDWR